VSTKRPPLIYKGRSLGILSVTAAQVLIGVIHVFFGFWLIAASGVTPLFSPTPSDYVYSVYTVVFGFLTLVFSFGLWRLKNWGWIGTIAVALFVTVADALTLLDLPSVPGIPKFAGAFEITYSVVIVLYLFQSHVRVRYKLRSQPLVERSI